MKGKDSLASFDIQDRRTRIRCAICKLPEASEINEQKRLGVSTHTIYKWLTKKKRRKVTMPQLFYHFYQAKHHLEG